MALKGYAMTYAERIVARIDRLPEDLQAEVLDFVKFLEARRLPDEEAVRSSGWSAFSLAQAMRGLESEPSIYEPDDLRERFQ